MNILPRDSFFDFDQLFKHVAFPSQLTDSDDSFFSPRVDITDHDDRFEIAAELAGVDRDNIVVTLDDGILTLKASVEQENTEQEQGKVIRKERRSGSFLRRFNVGYEVSESDISAKFENGLLQLSIPKRDKEKPQSKRIEIQ